jgi:hypothetical protein
MAIALKRRHDYGREHEVYREALFEADCLARFVTRGDGNLVVSQLESSSGQQMSAANNTTTALGEPRQTLMGQKPNPFLSLPGTNGLSQESNPMEQMRYGMAPSINGMTEMGYGFDPSNNNEIEGWGRETCNK